MNPSHPESGQPQPSHLPLAGLGDDGLPIHPDQDPFALGLLLGVLIGEGHFGGDGKQPQVTLRMHVRHRRLFDWIMARWPIGRLYGPYNHGGRRYYQLMFRGNALKTRLLPLLDSLPWIDIDEHTYERYAAMKRQYGLHEIPGSQSV